MASLNIEGVPEGMQEELVRAAQQNGRSLSSEALARLGSTFPTQDKAHWAGETKEERVQSASLRCVMRSDGSIPIPRVA